MSTIETTSKRDTELFFSARPEAPVWDWRRSEQLHGEWRMVTDRFGEKYCNYLNIFWKKFSVVRNAWKKEQYCVWMLSRAVCWYHLHHQHAAKNSLLLLQSDSSLSADCFNGSTRVHSTPWLWRKIKFRYQKIIV